MKLIFLDVDGVLNKLDSPSFYSLGKSKVKRLVKIVRETGAEICLSSTWRTDGKTFRKLALKLKNYDIKISYQTPIGKNIRGNEIKVILDKLYPERYIILDDMDVEEFRPEQIPYLIQTDGLKGLQDSHVKLAIDILNK